ncbi:3-keto-5-aminohexanoate cleavage protein [Leisingera daeponensis]|uniref:3-keto-5-aminohexanoate cleavage protein n=1 Tax=Leisingera daeponensis TaxID=405746 RepID=UPI001C93AA41|nr:3-keto-5-aminohexanoate cleavage protein [Leisingera daeponensis]MBY6059399.1 3-keto-5-aminohexanoate cleavage protein [Leisingera daeponensis]
MSRKVIITCAITGGHSNFAKVPDFPISPGQIVRDCLSARQAGASIVHIHVRDPETGQHSGELELFRQVVKGIRDSGSDLIINLTTGWGGRFVPGEDNVQKPGPGTNFASPERRVKHVVELRPDICTLDVGTLNFGEQVFIGFPPHLRKMASAMREAGVKPELEVFELGHIETAKSLIAEGLIEGTPLFQMCLGIPNAAPPRPEVLSLMQSMLPEGANWAAFAIGRDSFRMVAQAVLAGGHVRVGLEDTLYMGPGEFATNSKLVDRARQIIEALGAEVATPDDARAIIGLRRGPSK